MRRVHCDGPNGSGRRAWLRPVIIFLPLTLAASAAAAGQEREFSGVLNYDQLSKHAARGEAVRVRYSPGGTGAAAMQMATIKKLVIDGPCHSACAWAFIQNNNACFTRRAVFGFHGAADPGTGRPMLAATNYWLSHVRASLRERISGVTESLRLVYVSASELARHYPERVCGDGGTQNAARTDKSAKATYAAASLPTTEAGIKSAPTVTPAAPATPANVGPSIALWLEIARSAVVGALGAPDEGEPHETHLPDVGAVGVPALLAPQASETRPPEAPATARDISIGAEFIDRNEDTARPSDPESHASAFEGRMTFVVMPLGPLDQIPPAEQSDGATPSKPKA